MASQSDDRTVRIWRTKDWGCEKVINEPFEECGGTTHVLRLAWSPDGLYIVSAHAMNGGKLIEMFMNKNSNEIKSNCVPFFQVVQLLR